MKSEEVVSLKGKISKRNGIKALVILPQFPIPRDLILEDKWWIVGIIPLGLVSIVSGRLPH